MKRKKASEKKNKQKSDILFGKKIKSGKGSFWQKQAGNWRSFKHHGATDIKV